MAVAPYTARGARLYIGPAVTTVPPNAAAYAAVAWTEVQSLQTFSPFGEVRPVISRVVVGRDHPVKKVGPADPGNITITLYPDDGDAGQIALASAAVARSKYPVKIEHPAGSKLTPSASVSARYFSVFVAANSDHLGANDDLVVEQFTFEIISQIIRVASAAPPGSVGTAAGIGTAIGVGRAVVTAIGSAAGVGSASAVTATDNEVLVSGNTLSVGGKVLTL
jgi:hypothetical protein